MKYFIPISSNPTDVGSNNAYSSESYVNPYVDISRTFLIESFIDRDMAVDKDTTTMSVSRMIKDIVCIVMGGKISSSIVDIIYRYRTTLCSLAFKDMNERDGAILSCMDIADRKYIRSPIKFENPVINNAKVTYENFSPATNLLKNENLSDYDHAEFKLLNGAMRMKICISKDTRALVYDIFVTMDRIDECIDLYSLIVRDAINKSKIYSRSVFNTLTLRLFRLETTKRVRHISNSLSGRHSTIHSFLQHNRVEYSHTLAFLSCLFRDLIEGVWQFCNTPLSSFSSKESFPIYEAIGCMLRQSNLIKSIGVPDCLIAGSCFGILNRIVKGTKGDVFRDMNQFTMPLVRSSYHFIIPENLAKSIKYLEDNMIVSYDATMIASNKSEHFHSSLSLIDENSVIVRLFNSDSNNLSSV